MRNCCQVPTKSQFEKQYRKSIAWQQLLPKTCQKASSLLLQFPLQEIYPENTG